MKNVRAAIYGAGSLGTVLGAYITKNGGQIDLINRNKAHVAALKEKGATINGTVNMNVPVKALTPDEMEGK
ncbi:MAG: 2-dehydropantoate 2-reductase, partial [Clostridia bacterium]|nr:2-dehydropantoate 2-reductase [Clostridia bacterium]